MNIIIKHIELIKRIDRLICMKSTGGPEELAHKLGISKTKLYRTINLMKQLDAPVEYDFSTQSFVYVREVGFMFGFYAQQQVGEFVSG